MAYDVSLRRCVFQKKPQMECKKWNPTWMLSLEKKRVGFFFPNRWCFRCSLDVICLTSLSTRRFVAATERPWPLRPKFRKSVEASIAIHAETNKKKENRPSDVCHVSIRSDRRGSNALFAFTGFRSAFWFHLSAPGSVDDFIRFFLVGSHNVGRGRSVPLPWLTRYRQCRSVILIKNFIAYQLQSNKYHWNIMRVDRKRIMTQNWFL